MAEVMAERRNQMFPVLSGPQLARLEAIGHRRRVERGQVLVDVGQANPSFFVVLSGRLDVVQPVDTRELPITTHVVGQFTGEVNMLSGRGSLGRIRVGEPGEILELTPEALRKVVRTDSELSEILMRAFILRRVALIALAGGALVVIGSRHSTATLRIREFLIRNGEPHTYLDVDRDPAVQALLDRFALSTKDVPVVICRFERVLKNPSNEELSECLGINQELDATRVRDVVVVGAGPAGLAAAVYGASEGLDVLVLESDSPGGQAGSSSKIENYLGFPTGISGQALAGRAYTQAEKFGAEVAVARTAAKLRCGEGGLHTLELSSGALVRARAVVIASGARYRKLQLPELGRFEGVGVYYSATQMEAQLCEGEEVIVVGGANSAGQAAVFLAARARHVHMLVRGAGLSQTMSRYLIERIEEDARITVHPFTQVVGLEGGDRLERVVIRDARAERTETLPIRHVFIMTGASPNTEWLDRCIALDDKGFIKTGPDLTPEELKGWHLGRRPYLLETSIPGVFAVGDVRSGNVKRVASAVGEGSISIQLVHRVLTE